MKRQTRSFLLIAERDRLYSPRGFRTYYANTARVGFKPASAQYFDAAGVGLYILGFRLALYWRKRA